MESDGKDVGFIDDAIFGLSNLIAAQNHAINSYSESKNEDWLNIAKLVRQKRSQLLYKIVPDKEDERYCFCKHILAAATSFKELGDRATESEDLEFAKELYEDAILFEKLFILLTKEEEKNDVSTEESTITINKTAKKR